MLRCMQTAREIAVALGLLVKVEPGAMEILDERWYPRIPVPLAWHNPRVASLHSVPVDTAYHSPVPYPARHERFSESC